MFKVFVHGDIGEGYYAGEFAKFEDARLFSESWHKKQWPADPCVFIEDRVFASEVPGVPDIYSLYENIVRTAPNYARKKREAKKKGEFYRWELLSQGGEE
mgnify:FL=1